MSALRKGWCPGALRPMAAKDGLLVRLRPRCGTLPAATAMAVAALAERHGNGLFDLTARANVQLRGVTETALPALQDGLQALGLLDASAEAESVRNIVVSPLAGLHGGLDIGPLAAALEQRLAQDTALHALPGKFGFLIDDGMRPSLAGVDADVRFDWTGADFAIGLGGTRDAAVPAGMCAAGDLVMRAAEIAAWFLEKSRGNSEIRRMRDALPSAALFAKEERRGRAPHPTSADAEATFSREREKGTPRFIVGPHTICGDGLDVSAALTCLGLAAPFGRLDAAMLRAAAEAARGEIRLTPWRVLLLPGATAAHVPGFITDSADPRLSIAACPGAAGCARGTTDTHADAAALAVTLEPDGDIALHVSGCEKGCAKPSASPLTLVARDGRYDLVRDGRAGDAPAHRGLDIAAVRTILERELA